MIGEGRLSRRNVLKGAGAASVLALSGCLSEEESDGDWENEFELMHGWNAGDGSDALDALITAFEEEYPDMETDIRGIGSDGNQTLNDQIATRLQQAEPPGSFAGWPGKNLEQYGTSLGDIEESVWDEGDLKDAHMDEVVEACQHNDGFSAVPIGSHRMNDLFYSVEVLENAGVDPDGIDSFDAFVDALDAIDTETDATPYVNPLAEWTTLQFWAVAMQGTQGYEAYMDFIEGNGDVDAVQAAFEEIEVVLDEYINDDAPEIGMTEANDRIMADEAGFIHQGNWVAGAYTNNDLEYGEDWDRIPFPGTEDMYGFHLDSFVYPGGRLDNPSPEESQAFLRFVGTETAHVEFNKYKGSIPTRETDTSEFNEYLTETIEEFQEAELRPPTIAHGLAVTQDIQTDLEGALNQHFLDPFDAEAVAQRFVEIV